MPDPVLKLLPTFHPPVPDVDHDPVIVLLAPKTTFAVNTALKPDDPTFVDSVTFPAGDDTFIPFPPSIVVGTSTVIVVIEVKANLKFRDVPLGSVYGDPELRNDWPVPEDNVTVPPDEFLIETSK